MALELSNNSLKGVFSDGVTRRISFPHVGRCSGRHSYECRARIVPTILLHSRHCTWMCESGHPWRSDGGGRTASGTAVEEQSPRCVRSGLPGMLPLAHVHWIFGPGSRLRADHKSRKRIRIFEPRRSFWLYAASVVRHCPVATSLKI
jgi:hypothetical protein